MSSPSVPNRVANLPMKQKIAAGLIAAGLFFVLSMCVCSGSTWYFSSELAIKRERERAAADKEKAIQEVKDAIAKLITVPVVPIVPVEKKPAVQSELLPPDKAVIIDNVKIEIVEAFIGKAKLMEFNGPRLSPSEYTQIKIRVTNNKENIIIDKTYVSGRASAHSG